MLFACNFESDGCGLKTTLQQSLQHMTRNMGNSSTMTKYHVLDDGRIVELKIGKPSNSDDAIWARKLTAREKETYLKLKGLGLSDTDIYNHFNQKSKKKACAGG